MFALSAKFPLLLIVSLFHIYLRGTCYCTFLYIVGDLLYSSTDLAGEPSGPLASSIFPPVIYFYVIISCVIDYCPLDYRIIYIICIVISLPEFAYFLMYAWLVASPL